MGGGGVGGGGGDFDGRVEGFEFDGDQNVLTRRADDGTIRQLPQQAQADRVESLYAYPLGKLSLEPGDRMARMLFSQPAPYSNLFIWNVDVSTQVSNILRLTNNSKVPWTGGRALVLKNEIPLAQLEMPFTPVGQVANIELGKSQDIVVGKEVRQLRTEDATFPKLPKEVFRRTVEETVLTVTNTRSEPAQVEVRLTFVGEALETSGAKITKVGPLDAYNLKFHAQWTMSLAPGATKEVKLVRGQLAHVGTRH